MPRFYISYHKNDWDFVEGTLLPELEQAGFTDWIDIDRAEIDPELSNGLNSAINRCFAFIVVVSEHSMKSEVAKFEWGYAHYINKPILPVKIQSPEVIGMDGKLQVVYEVHEKLARLEWFNFINKDHAEWDKLKSAMFELEQSLVASY